MGLKKQNVNRNRKITARPTQNLHLLVYYNVMFHAYKTNARCKNKITMLLPTIEPESVQ